MRIFGFDLSAKKTFSDEWEKAVEKLTGNPDEYFPKDKFTIIPNDVGGLMATVREEILLASAKRDYAHLPCLNITDTNAHLHSGQHYKSARVGSINMRYIYKEDSGLADVLFERNLSFAEERSVYVNRVQLSYHGSDRNLQSCTLSTHDGGSFGNHLIDPFDRVVLTGPFVRRDHQNNQVNANVIASGLANQRFKTIEHLGLLSVLLEGNEKPTNTRITHTLFDKVRPKLTAGGVINWLQDELCRVVGRKDLFDTKKEE